MNWTPRDVPFKISRSAPGSLSKQMADGVRTPDIWSEGCTKVGTKEMGQEIIRRI